MGVPVSDLQLSYDVLQDRLVLALSDAAGVHRFWLTRRQCVALVLACRAAEGVPSPLKVAPAMTAGQPQQGQGDAARPAQQEPVGAAEHVASPDLVRLGLRRVPQGLRLTLGAAGPADQGPVHLLLKPGDQLSLLRSLRHLATQAQWDLDVAESRAAAHALIRKARAH